MPSDPGPHSTGSTGTDTPADSVPPPDPVPSRPTASRRGGVRRVVGMLPSPRDEALVEIGRAIRDFVRGRVPQAIVNARRADLEEERRRLEHGRTRLAEGDPAGALEEVTTVERLRPAASPPPR